MSDPRASASRASAPSVGAPINRVDGRLKVTGGAKYAAEFAVPNVAHAVIVTSTIAKGRVHANGHERRRACAGRAGGVDAAERAALARRAHREPSGDARSDAPAGRSRALQRSADRRRRRRHVRARDGRGRSREGHVREGDDRRSTSRPRRMRPTETHVARRAADGHSQRGDTAKGLADAEVKVEHTYTTPFENHNPMEPHNTHRGVGRRQAHALRLDAGHLQRAKRRRARVRHPAGQRARRVVLHRRRIRQQGRPVVARVSRGDGGEAGRRGR